MTASYSLSLEDSADRPKQHTEGHSVTPEHGILYFIEATLAELQHYPPPNAVNQMPNPFYGISVNTQFSSLKKELLYMLNSAGNV